MLIHEFSFGNFKSFKDIQTLNMRAAAITSQPKRLDEDNVHKGHTSTLKSKALYGANASGKSNVNKALVYFIRIIANSVSDPNILAGLEPFRLDSEKMSEPSYFQMIFELDGMEYRYGFEVNRDIIHSEWLFARPEKQMIPFFIRENDMIIDVDKTNFSEGFKMSTLMDGEDQNSSIYRSNSLMLSTLASFGFGKISKKIVSALSSIIVIRGLRDKKLLDMAFDSLIEDNKHQFIQDFLKQGDTGIQGIFKMNFDKSKITDEVIQSYPDMPDEFSRVLSMRESRDQQGNISLIPFDFINEESEGTLKMLEFAPLIYDALYGNRPLVIDEFDARFHPLLTKKIVELFNSDENKGSQLIFVTHDTNLLDSSLLRRDQIDFVEKDKYGVSHLYSLTDFKGVRNTGKFEKDYIHGKYGAIPFLGNFEHLISQEKDA